MGLFENAAERLMGQMEADGLVHDATVENLKARLEREWKQKHKPIELIYQEVREAIEKETKG